MTEQLDPPYAITADGTLIDLATHARIGHVRRELGHGWVASYVGRPNVCNEFSSPDRACAARQAWKAWTYFTSGPRPGY
ncbi:Uncharacterised protein (plasmid) [Tsukamurella tyrosinosolvens]|uniref:Uncharacterized protein n=2 Tax=Tsukamurella tyrosinosolvens TaxID=57704 RepID=A0A1H4UK63_TSUTY|nr:hypothetical protein AXK58_13585 [Tsukamurella tyrosinosolvens]SEC68758.1 hypothetical protein SAMN04489793_2922 [Tsukamurella tyrosinosolvens]VEH94266.1 Uncharacterised protein [Tsukamurella tyrosinosolvens]